MVNNEFSNVENGWSMIQTGGSIGEARFFNAAYGAKKCKLIESNMTEEDAKAKAKRWNKMLTPGEKKYYRIRYTAVSSQKVSII